MEPIPRICSVGELPACPELLVTCSPATLPVSALSKLVTGLSAKSLALTIVAEPA